ncbi:hypothetical protein BC332_24504 [Capsicum chinense]|nr:hypothetical protein BC332_24504 [Capsicum chinense]
MWKSEPWDAVRLCFPSENKGSGILLTTRNTEVARDAGTENLSLQMGIMDQYESWNIFKSATSANEALSYELLKSKRAIDNWKSVAKDVRSLVTNDPDELCSRVLGLSYNHLTSDPKACLLHFWIFPEDGEIPVKNLMRSWMAEGFLKLENDLEGEAEKCLQELVDRCLVLICKKSQDGTKIRSCKVHDLIHDLCLREVQRGNFFIMNDIVLDVSDSGCRSLSIHKMQPFKRMTGDEIDYCPKIAQVDLLTKESTWIFQIYKHCCTKEVILGIQNVKELGICGYEADSNSIQDSGLPNNLVHLQQLETLSFIGCFHLLPSSAKAFPATLKKLKLRLTLLSWSYLDIIAELPNLEALKLMISACFDKNIPYI